jgi:hypothetical protein
VSNADTQAAWAYHDGTKHSVASVQSSGHALDWSNQPLPFKDYTSLDPILLSDEVPASTSGVTGVEAIAGVVPVAPGPHALDRASLARLCLLSNGYTKVLTTAGGGRTNVDFRGRGGAVNATVAVGIDSEAFIRLLIERIRSLG